MVDRIVAPSSKGKTADFESANRGSNPRGASKAGRTGKGWQQLKRNRKKRVWPSPEERLFMVYCEGGDLPSVVHSDFDVAAKEAARLSHFNPGKRFHLLMTQRIQCRAIATAAGTDETRSGSAEGKGAGRKASPKPNNIGETNDR